MHKPNLILLAPACFAETGAQSVPQQVSDSHNNVRQHVEPNESRAVQTSTRCYEQALASACSQSVPAMGELPAARFQYNIGSAQPPQNIVCVELVHLQADRDNARLLSQHGLHLTSDQERRFYASFNDLVAADGLEIVQDDKGQWFLTGMSATYLDTWPAHAVANRDIANFLPRGTNAGDWRRLFTEAQMLFHSHPANAERASNGHLPVNALWFWGGAAADVTEVSAELTVHADDTYTNGFCRATDIEIRELKEFRHSLGQALSKNQEIIMFDSADTHVVVDLAVYHSWLSGDQTSLAESKSSLLNDVITPLQQLVSDCQLSSLTIDGCDGHAIVEVAPTDRPEENTSESEKGFLSRIFRSGKRS